MRTVTAPDGSAHRVQIEWIGNRMRRVPSEVRQRVKRQSRRAARGADGADGCLDVDLGDFFVVIGVVVAAVLLFIVGVPVLAGLVEVLAVVAIASVVWAIRVLFRRPWSVVHEGPDGPQQRCLVVGWRRAHSVMVAAAHEVAATGSAIEAFSSRDGVLPVDVAEPPVT